MADEDAIYREEAAARHGVLFFDSWPFFLDAGGHYDTFLPGDNGLIQGMRTGDGIHLTRAGADRLAKAVLAALDQVTPVLPAH